MNGRRVDLLSAWKVPNSLGEEWLVVDDPPLRRGENRILVVIEGFDLPEGYEQKGPGPGAGWPTLHQCELLVRCAG